MKILRAKHLAVVAAMLAFTSVGCALDEFVMSVNYAADDAHLRALAMVETGAEPSRIGAAGERSAFQISPLVWHTWTLKPFSAKHTQNPELSAKVAKLQLAWLCQTFMRFSGGKTPSDVDLYVMWNAGFSYYQRKQFNALRVSKEIRERAIRYGNLVHLYTNLN